MMRCSLLQPVTYLAMHTFASWLSLLPTKIWFDHYWAHTAITAAVLLVSVWNGAQRAGGPRRSALVQGVGGGIRGARAVLPVCRG